MTRLRITGGSARGRILREPLAPGIRPTTDRVREALFSMLGQDLTGSTWLDAYGGSGIVGLEAWSRGARVSLVEKDARAFAAIRRRGQELGADWRLRRGDSLRVSPSLGRFDRVFADPPYAFDPVPVLEALAPCADGLLILESEGVDGLPARVAGLVRGRSRSYGRSFITLYERDVAAVGD